MPGGDRRRRRPRSVVLGAVALPVARHDLQPAASVAIRAGAPGGHGVDRIAQRPGSATSPPRESADRARHPAVAVPPAQPSQRRRRRAPLLEIQLPGRQTPPPAPTALVDGNHVAGKVVGTGDKVIVRHRANITPGRLARSVNSSHRPGCRRCARVCFSRDTCPNLLICRQLGRKSSAVHRRCSHHGC